MSVNVARILARHGRPDTPPAEQSDAAAAPPAVKPARKAAAESDAPAKPQRSRGEWSRAVIFNVVLPLTTFVIVLGVWAFVQSKLVPDFPTPGRVWDRAVEIFAHPFYNNGPNDMGIGWQLLYSLGRVMAGFGLSVLVGVPIGLLMGTSKVCRSAWQPLIQILRPVSPLAWLPIGLLLFKAVDPSAIFVIFITCIWPTLLNTAAGVQAIPKDYMNVAAVLQLRRWEIARRILLPAALPYIVTGMRLSLNIAWMVIVAAEMLTGGIGIGFYIWDEWNNLNVPSIIVCIVLIGLVGIVLDTVMSMVQRRFDYQAR